LVSQEANMEFLKFNIQIQLFGALGVLLFHLKL
jgi:hypothetical protein